MDWAPALLLLRVERIQPGNIVAASQREARQESERRGSLLLFQRLRASMRLANEREGQQMAVLGLADLEALHDLSAVVQRVLRLFVDEGVLIAELRDLLVRGAELAHDDCGFGVALGAWDAGGALCLRRIAIVLGWLAPIVASDRLHSALLVRRRELWVGLRLQVLRRWLQRNRSVQRALRVHGAELMVADSIPSGALVGDRLLEHLDHQDIHQERLGVLHSLAREAVQGALIHPLLLRHDHLPLICVDVADQVAALVIAFREPLAGSLREVPRARQRGGAAVKQALQLVRVHAPDGVALRRRIAALPGLRGGVCGGALRLASCAPVLDPQHDVRVRETALLPFYAAHEVAHKERRILVQLAVPLNPVGLRERVQAEAGVVDVWGPLALRSRLHRGRLLRAVVSHSLAALVQVGLREGRATFADVSPAI